MNTKLVYITHHRPSVQLYVCKEKDQHHVFTSILHFKKGPIPYMYYHVLYYYTQITERKSHTCSLRAWCVQCMYKDNTRASSGEIVTSARYTCDLASHVFLNVCSGTDYCSTTHLVINIGCSVSCSINHIWVIEWKPRLNRVEI